MGEYTIRSVGEPKPWSNDFGSFLSYPVDLEDESGHKHIGVEWSRKSDSKPPQVEDQIAGEITESQYGSKIKVDYDATKELKGGGGRPGGGGEYSGSRGGGEYMKPQPPDAVARMGRAAAQKSAIQAATSAGYFQGEITFQKLDDDLRPLIDWFAGDIDLAGKAADEGDAGLRRGPGNAGLAGDKPRTSAASPQKPPHEDIYGLLEKAGVPGPISTLLTSWMIETQSPEKQDEAISALQDDARREKCVAWAKAGYEAKHGPLPVVSTEADSEIPF